jgi:hypothetical protein
MSVEGQKTKGWVFGGEEPEWLVWLLVVVLLLGGIALKGAVTGRTESYKESGITVSYPAGWMREEVKGEGEKLRVKETFSSGQYPVRVEVWEKKVEEVSKKGGTLSELALALSMKRKGELQAYRVLSMRPEVVGGLAGVVTEYGYVAPKEQGVGAGSLPVVARAEELVVVKGDKLVQVRYAAKAEEYEARGEEREKVIKSVRVE